MSIFSFVSSMSKDSNFKKRSAEAMMSAKYEQKLLEYREALENYKRCIVEYEGYLEKNGSKNMDNQLFMVQTALDLAYVKEQGELTREAIEALKDGYDNKAMHKLESLMEAVVETNYKLDGADQNVVGRLSDILLEIQKQNTYLIKQSTSELTASLDKLSTKVKKGKILIGFLFTINLLSIIGITFVILYLLDVIAIW